MSQLRRTLVIFGALMALSLFALTLIGVTTSGVPAQARQQSGREAGAALLRLFPGYAGNPHPRVTGHGTTPISASMNLSPASPRVVLYDQYDNPDPLESGTSSQVFGAPYSDYDDQAADD